MPDITMCCNYECPFRKKCYRYRAVPDEYWQSFASYNCKTSNIVGGAVTQCDRFWNIEETNQPILPTEEVDKRNRGGDK